MPRKVYEDSDVILYKKDNYDGAGFWVALILICIVVSAISDLFDYFDKKITWVDGSHSITYADFYYGNFDEKTGSSDAKEKIFSAIENKKVTWEVYVSDISKKVIKWETKIDGYELLEGYVELSEGSLIPNNGELVTLSFTPYELNIIGGNEILGIDGIVH